MLQTIEVQIDNHGMIYPMEPQIKLPVGRALLTLLDNNVIKQPEQLEIENPFDDLFGIVKATHSVSLEEIELAISEQGLEGFNDCN
jgi:hypothetical protein